MKTGLHVGRYGGVEGQIKGEEVRGAKKKKKKKKRQEIWGGGKGSYNRLNMNAAQNKWRFFERDIKLSEKMSQGGDEICKAATKERAENESGEEKKI